MTLTGDYNAAFFNRDDDDGIKHFAQMFGPYGTSQLCLTEKDMQNLRDGQVIVWGDGETTRIICYQREESGDDET